MMDAVWDKIREAERQMSLKDVEDDYRDRKKGGCGKDWQENSTEKCN